MANAKKQVAENVPGDFFVDSTCIDCDACRQIAPAVFGGLHDATGAYPEAFLAGAVLQAVAAGIIVLGRRGR